VLGSSLLHHLFGKELELVVLESQRPIRQERAHPEGIERIEPGMAHAFVFGMRTFIDDAKQFQQQQNASCASGQSGTVAHWTQGACHYDAELPTYSLSYRAQQDNCSHAVHASG